MIGALVVVAVAVVSLSAIVFQGRDGGDDEHSSSATTTTTAPPPTTVDVSPPAPGTAPACDGPANGVVDAMNGDRAGSGLGSLCSNAALTRYAQTWAERMARQRSLTHQDLGGILARTSFSTVAENVLSGPGTMSVDRMEAAWMASPPHRRNVLDGRYTAAGVGLALSDDGRVWVAVEFGG